jgi:hypothetical protein
VKRRKQTATCLGCGATTSHGYNRCWTCYKREARSPEAIAARFWANVDQSAGPDACWPWTGTNTHGYGELSIAQRRAVRAPRLSWEIAHGRPFPVGMNALHHCDNPPCVNPTHIYPGTQADNVRDMHARGRWQRRPRQEASA